MKCLQGFDLIRIGAGDVEAGRASPLETVLYVLTGSLSVTVGQDHWRYRGTRGTVLEGPPTAFYVPPHAAWSVAAETDLEFFVMTSDPASGALAEKPTPHCFEPDDLLTLQADGTREALLDVVLGPGNHSATFIVGETVIPPHSGADMPPAQWSGDAVLFTRCRMTGDEMHRLGNGRTHRTTASDSPLYCLFVLAGPDKDGIRL